MEGSYNSDAGCDQASSLVTPYYTPYQKQVLQKSGLQPVNMDLSPSSAGNSSVTSTKEEGPGSSSSSSSDSEEEFPDLMQQNQIVGEQKADNILLERDDKSYDELLKKFIKNEEELKLSNLKLQLSEKEIMQLKNQIEKTEGRLDNVQKELKMKQDALEYEKGQVLEMQKRTADLETHVPDCCYKIAKLVEQVEVANEQLKISNDEIARLKEELNKSSGTHELQGQLEAAQESVAALECQLDSGRKHIRELEDRVTWYKTNETSHELEVQKLKAEMLDVQVKFSLEKDQLHSDIVSLSEVKKQLGSRLEEWESRSNVLENKLRQFEAEKLKQEELHATQQMVLQGEISCLKEELGRKRHDVEAVNKDFDRHKQKYDMLMTERDGANAKIDKLMAEVSFRDNQIANMERELLQLHAQQAELMISGSEARLNLENELKLKVEEYDRHKQKYDMLMTERDGANAKIDKLMAEVSFRDNQIANMERELFQLRAQQAELISGSETRLNLVNELKLKVVELEKEVTRQNAVISDRAEEKREAIRQLCFSLEHYRSGYQELLQAFTGHKRHAVIAS